MLWPFPIPAFNASIPRLLIFLPPILIRMVRDPLVHEYDLSHVTRFSSGAAPLSEEIIHFLQFPKRSSRTQASNRVMV
ncbi:hypothetical protein DM02DRAFT_616913 [Periconia macrospinosa]|uniref:Uncharacterized protein n=1 Tax=Periconia macrospinosa TaxID=97972 RepID=A0A2V1DFJ3_9PLEO|nr:hypothetical protein DM02DRAFT_616913 [Periconia macrospinosa]